MRQKQERTHLFIRYHWLITLLIYIIYPTFIIQLLKRFTSHKDRFTRVKGIFTCCQGTLTDINHFVPVWKGFFLIWGSRFIIL